MKRETIDYLSIIGVIIVCLMVIAVCVFAITMARRDIARTKQPKVYMIDTTQVDVIYENTWGKILFLKEEDL